MGQMADLLNEIIRIGGTTAFEDPVTAQDLAGLVSQRRRLLLPCRRRQREAIAGFQALETSDAYGAGIGEISTFARQTPKTPGTGTALFKATENAARAARPFRHQREDPGRQCAGARLLHQDGVSGSCRLSRTCRSKTARPLIVCLKRYSLA